MSIGISPLKIPNPLDLIRELTQGDAGKSIGRGIDQGEQTKAGSPEFTDGGPFTGPPDTLEGIFGRTSDFLEGIARASDPSAIFDSISSLLGTMDSGPFRSSNVLEDISRSDNPVNLFRQNPGHLESAAPAVASLTQPAGPGSGVVDGSDASQEMKKRAAEVVDKSKSGFANFIDDPKALFQ